LIGDFPIKYLGVPLSAGRLHVVDWKKLEEKLEKKLDVWQGNSLSIGGWSILIYPAKNYYLQDGKN
jgi:hypothetical protein